jgi:hypothetical protein
MFMQFGNMDILRDLFLLEIFLKDKKVVLLTVDQEKVFQALVVPKPFGQEIFVSMG